MYPDRANPSANLIHDPCTCTRTEHQLSEQSKRARTVAPFHFPFIPSPLPTRATHQHHHLSPSFGSHLDRAQTGTLTRSGHPSTRRSGFSSPYSTRLRHPPPKPLAAATLFSTRNHLLLSSTAGHLLFNPLLLSPILFNLAPPEPKLSPDPNPSRANSCTRPSTRTQHIRSVRAFFTQPEQTDSRAEHNHEPRQPRTSHQIFK